MKKTIIVISLLLILALLALPALANQSVVQDNWLNQKLNWQKDKVDALVQAGAITAQQGQELKNNLDQNYKLRQESGFVCPGGGQGGKSDGLGGFGHGYGPGHGHGKGMGMGMLGESGACPYYQNR